MTSSPTRLQELTTQETELLAQLLSFQPGYPINTDSSWIHDQHILLSTFPSSLLRSHSLFPCLRGLRCPKAQLCHTHKALDGPLIHALFLEITAECTTQLSSFLQFLEKPHAFLETKSQKELHELIYAQRPFIKRMQALNGLWMTSKFYKSLFTPWLASPSDFCFEKVDSGCEACILASMGGSRVVVSDLRASMRGRRKRGSGHSAALRIVESWIDWTGSGEQIREESGRLAKELVRCRREMQKARRMERGAYWKAAAAAEEDGKRCEGAVSLALSNGGIDEKADKFGFEESIIDFYAKRMSTASPISRVRTAEGLHDAFKKSIICDPNGQFRRARSNGQSLSNISTYTNSVYSVSNSKDYAAACRDILATQRELNREVNAPLSQERLYNFF